MKTDLTTSILAAVFGFVVAFVVTNLLMPGLSDFSFKTLDSAPDSSLAEPNEDVFNYRAVNPTVEVYVGDDDNDAEDIETIEDTTVPEPARPTTDESEASNTTTGE